MLITLTTDLGTRDFYVGAVKGALLTAIPDAQLVDISHNIDPQNVLHGAFVLKNSYRHFPADTLHLIGVNTFHDGDSSVLVIQHEGHSFIGHDNGLFGLIWDDVMPKDIFRITPLPDDTEHRLPLSRLFVHAAKHLTAGGSAAAIGVKIKEYRKMMQGKPIVATNFIKGSIIYFDRFGNAMVNIRREEFDRERKGRSFLIIFKRYTDVESLSLNYASVEESEKLCFFNSAGYLEIAINKGNARHLLNLSEGDFVQIEFQS